MQVDLYNGHETVVVVNVHLLSTVWLHFVNQFYTDWNYKWVTGYCKSKSGTIILYITSQNSTTL